MEISAVMNIHEMAVSKAIIKRTDDQARHEKTNHLPDIKESDQEEKVARKSSFETYPVAFTNTVEQQDDTQSSSIRVERKMDAQAAKQSTQLQAEGGDITRKTGSLVDVIT